MLGFSRARSGALQDWEYFLEENKSVQRQHLQAFQSLLDSLRVCLWPDPVQFPWLERNWRPAVKERNQAENLCMIRRLKKECRSSQATGCADVFCDVAAFDVVPVCLTGIFRTWVGQLMRQSLIFATHSEATATQCFSVICAFAVGDRQAFSLAPGSLRKVGHSMAQRGKALQRGCFRGSAGSFGSICARSSAAVSSFWGKQVRILRVCYRVNPSKIAAFLDTKRDFLLPRQEDVTKRNLHRHCWHAVFLFHCTRCCVGPDAERWSDGSR